MSKFLRRLKKLDPQLRQEIYEKVGLFKDPANHDRLRVHVLRGNLSGFWSFSVNYKIRIVFEYRDNETVNLLSVGGHDVYKH
ncbi:type II toxin-antitoxin system mRNA interferase toxin, RelE/StbE family [Candidatus Nomurabacteria bacterium]|nr:type II toxin-antitoxin system mRNA interferase toxin, RelE/StbE family [Candidatus Nomurabacteria bacterium]